MAVGYVSIAKSQKSLKIKINGEKYFVDLYQLSKAIENGKYAPLILVNGNEKKVDGYVALSKNKKALIIKSGNGRYFALIEHIKELLDGKRNYAIIINGNGNGNGKQINKLELAKETINKIVPTRIEIFREKLNKLLQ